MGLHTRFKHWATSLYLAFVVLLAIGGCDPSRTAREFATASTGMVGEHTDLRGALLMVQARIRQRVSELEMLAADIRQIRANTGKRQVSLKRGGGYDRIPLDPQISTFNAEISRSLTAHGIVLQRFQFVVAGAPSRPVAEPFSREYRFLDGQLVGHVEVTLTVSAPSVTSLKAWYKQRRRLRRWFFVRSIESSRSGTRIVGRIRYYRRVTPPSLRAELPTLEGGLRAQRITTSVGEIRRRFPKLVGQIEATIARAHSLKQRVGQGLKARLEGELIDHRCRLHERYQRALNRRSWAVISANL